MLLIDFINRSGRVNYTFMDGNDNDEDENINDYKLLDLKKFISYKKINIHNKIDDYLYKISFKFKDYVKIIINKEMHIQFKFWFHFLLQKIKINISSIEYEYYMNYNEIKINNKHNYENGQKTINYNQLIKEKLINFLFEYENFIDNLFNEKSSISIFKNMHKNKRPKVTLILINNMKWLNYLLIKLEKETYNIGKLLFNYITSVKNVKNEVEEIKTSENKNILENKKALYYNNIYIKLFGKYSIYQLESIFNIHNINSIENIIIKI